MPNGGSDCCGTCWFNSFNNGKLPEDHSVPEQENKTKCTIRNFDIIDPFGTYCANHPNHQIKKIDIPIGPVYTVQSYPYQRRVWLKSPDNEIIRKKLLEMLSEIDLNNAIRYPSPTSSEKILMQQLAEFKETRAISILQKIIEFDVTELIDDENSRVLDKCLIIGQATEALLHIGGSIFLKQVEDFLNIGVKGSDMNYDPSKDNYAPIRYHLFKGIQFCMKEDLRKAASILNEGIKDPNPFVRECVYEGHKRVYDMVFQKKRSDL